MNSLMPTVPFSSHAGGALIASPSSAFREQVVHRLNGSCRPVQQTSGGAEALAQLESGKWKVLFLDRRLPDLDAEELAAIIQERFPSIPVVLVDSEEPPGLAREHDHGESELEPALQAAVSRSEEDRGREACPREAPLPGMIGTSVAMQQVYRMVRLVAPRTTTVLIAGATGSGKELVARALHQLSPRSAKPFVVVNCAAIPEALLESELFGYARGAFTGAVQAQIGRIPAAHGGTLFLDEVSELPLGMQAKLLRFLEQKEVQRLGATEATRVDVRVLAASNVDLAGSIARGKFREDLFYRLWAFPITLPSLAERRADIVVLAEHFLACMAAAMGTACPRISSSAALVLESHPWKGNVRELQHVMERASILVEQGNAVLPEHLCFPTLSAAMHPLGGEA